MEGEEAGMVKKAGNLTFLKVAKAGHMVPYNQPANSLEMIRQFTKCEGIEGGMASNDVSVEM